MSLLFEAMTALLRSRQKERYRSSESPSGTSRNTGSASADHPVFSRSHSSPRLTGITSTPAHSNARADVEWWNRNLLVRAMYHLLTCSPSHFCWVLLVWFLPLLFLALCTAIVLASRNTLIAALPADAEPNLFSEGRAMALYDSVAGMNVSRPVGTRHNQITAREGLLQTLREYRAQAVKSDVRVEIVEQPFEADVFGEPLRNVLARVSDARKALPTGADSDSVMVSSHYDTVFSSPGGADDGIGVVTMLEMLRVLTQRSPPSLPVIFHFNNGEEAGLLGAKAFINQKDETSETYKWMKSVRRVLNIDANGRNGRVTMFRLQGGSVACAEYAVVPHPNGNVVGEEALEFIPNYTDFTAYMNMNNIVGMDFALFEDGYTYHTSKDRASTLTPGSIQEFGENLMALVEAYSYVDGEKSPLHQRNDNTETKYVYFDILGLVFFHAEQMQTTVFQAILVLISLSLPIVRFTLEFIFEFSIQRRKEKKDLKERLLFVKWSDRVSTKSLGRSLMGLIMTYLYALGFAFSFVMGIVFALLAGVVCHLTHPMVWYASMPVTLFIFGVPCLLGMVIGQFITSQCVVQCSCVRFAYKSLYKKKNTISSDKRLHNKINKSIYSFSKERYIGLNVLWGAAVLMVTILQLRSMYAIVIFSTCTNVLVVACLAMEKVILACAFFLCNRWRSCYSKKRILLVDEFENDAMAMQLRDENEYDSDASDQYMVNTAILDNNDSDNETYDKNLGKLAVLSRQKSFKKKTAKAFDSKTFTKQFMVNPFLKQRIYWVTVPLIAGFVGSIVALQVQFSLLAMMMPNMGYQRVNSDLIVAAMVAFFTALIILNFMPLIQRGANFVKLILILAACTVTALCLTVLFQQPYDPEHPHLARIEQNYRRMSFTTRSDPTNVVTESEVVDVTVASRNKNSVEEYIIKPYERLLQTQFNRVANGSGSATIRIPDDQPERIRELPRFKLPNLGVSNIVLEQKTEGTEYATFNMTMKSNYPATWYNELDVKVVSELPMEEEEYISVDYRNDKDEERICDVKKQGLVKRNFESTQWNVLVSGRVRQTRISDAAQNFGLAITVRSAFCDGTFEDSTTFVRDMLEMLPSVIHMGTAHCDYMITSSTLHVDMKQ